MPDPTRKLVDELCSRVDEATILCISGDYDLHTQDGFTAAREVLLTISKDVEAEEATGFNASGYNGDDFAGLTAAHDNGFTGAAPAIGADLNDGATVTTETSPAPSVFSSSSKASLLEDYNKFRRGAKHDLTDEQKIQWLASIFTSLQRIDITLALSRAKGSVEVVMDDLLNIEQLESEGQRPRGIDAFYVSDDDVPKGKGKHKRRKSKATQAAVSKSADDAASVEELGRDEATKQDHIELIAKSFNLSVSDIAEQYQRNKFSPGATIVEILDNFISTGFPTGINTEYEKEIQEERKRVPWVPHVYLGPLFENTTSATAAVELINVLAKYFHKPAYTKFNLDYSIAGSPARHLFSAKDALPARRRSLSSQLRPECTHSRRTSSAKAELIAGLRPINEEANAWVDGRSTKREIDLHGVSVTDGVNIALERIWHWWDTLETQSTHEGLRVVTGRGKHNPSGASPLNAAVHKALVGDGWIFESQIGAFLITGRQR